MGMEEWKDNSNEENKNLSKRESEVRLGLLLPLSLTSSVVERMKRQGLSGVHAPRWGALSTKRGSTEIVQEVCCGY